MKFSAFIRENLDAIIGEWERFARTLLPSASTMSALALRDHSREILLAVAMDMETRETEVERAIKSRGLAPALSDAPETAASEHGALRHLSGFDLVQLVAEFRAMRASVLALWQRSRGAASVGAPEIEEITRFNEAIDQALAESVDSYSVAVSASRDMFLAVLGHDLRGPLSGIGMSNVLLTKPELADADRHEVAMRIKRAVGTMDRLITDLLDYTRVRLGSGIPISLAACDLGHVATRSWTWCRRGSRTRDSTAAIREICRSKRTQPGCTRSSRTCWGMRYSMATDVSPSCWRRRVARSKSRFASRISAYLSGRMPCRRSSSPSSGRPTRRRN